MYIQEKDLKLNKGYYIRRKYLPYEGKLMLAKRRIMEWYDYWDGQVYVSFSGGLDSTVLLALVRMTLGSEIPAVFCNTGLEFRRVLFRSGLCQLQRWHGFHRAAGAGQDDAGK